MLFHGLVFKPWRIWTRRPLWLKTLLGMLLHDLGQDYLQRRNGLVEAVTLDDLRRVSARLFAGELLVSVVGDPQGL